MKILVIIAVIILIIIGIFTVSNISNSNILVIDDFEGEIAPRTIDFVSGGGSELRVRPSKDIKYSGKQALKLEYDSVEGGYMWVARGYDLDVEGAGRWLKKPTEINWPDYQAFGFYMYGQNSGDMLAVDLVDADSEHFRFMVNDDFEGWKEVICPFNDFFVRDDWQPDKAQKNGRLDFPVKAFQFEPRSIAKGSFYLDCVHLIKKE
jgi:hypothetical protein